MGGWVGGWVHVGVRWGQACSLTASQALRILHLFLLDRHCEDALVLMFQVTDSEADSEADSDLSVLWSGIM